jgi:SAM-dependent methyltransferase
MALRLKLPPQGTLTPIGESDPLRFYYKPVIGRVFQARINLGLQLLEGRFRRLLEIGYGSGLLMPTLDAIADEVYGADIDEEPAGLRATLAQLGVRPRELVKADVQSLPYPDSYFDAVVAFSILEHLDHEALQRAASQVARVLQPGGVFLVGCPAVHRAMNAAFFAIGFKGIGNHHLSSILDVLDACASRFEVVRKATLPRALERALPLGWAPYTTVLFARR